jgi:hypothetical protein
MVVKWGRTLVVVGSRSVRQGKLKTRVKTPSTWDADVDNAIIYNAVNSNDIVAVYGNR